MIWLRNKHKLFGVLLLTLAVGILNFIYFANLSSKYNDLENRVDQLEREMLVN